MARPTRPITETVPIMIGWSKGTAAQVSLPSISLLPMRCVIGARPPAGDGFEEALGDRSVSGGLDRLAWLGKRGGGRRVGSLPLRLSAFNPGRELIRRNGGHLEAHVREAVAAELRRKALVQPSLVRL